MKNIRIFSYEPQGEPCLIIEGNMVVNGLWEVTWCNEEKDIGCCIVPNCYGGDGVTPQDGRFFFIGTVPEKWENLHYNEIFHKLREDEEQNIRGLWRKDY